MKKLHFDTIGRYKLDPSVDFEHDIHDGTHYLFNSELNVFAIGPTIEDAVDDIECYLDFLWESYVCADPATLSEGAQRYAERIRRSVILPTPE